MYESYFDDDVDYTSEAVLERAYALGVASVCDTPGSEEYERLKANSPDAYDESILELAYEEGRARALSLEADDEPDEEIWERLVEQELGDSSGDDAETDTPADGLPESLSESPLSDGPPESLSLPSFLRR